MSSNLEALLGDNENDTNDQDVSMNGSTVEEDKSSSNTNDALDELFGEGALDEAEAAVGAAGEGEGEEATGEQTEEQAEAGGDEQPVITRGSSDISELFGEDNDEVDEQNIETANQDETELE